MIKIKRKKGFTLIEVLISMLIISIVMAMTMPAITKQKHSGVGEKWDYSLMPYNIRYSTSTEKNQNVSIGTQKVGKDTAIGSFDSRLTVQGSKWTKDDDMSKRTADMILQSTVSPWTVLGFTNGIFLEEEDDPTAPAKLENINTTDSIAKLMFDNRNNIGMGRSVFSAFMGGSNNIALGRAFSSAKTGSSNIAVGAYSLNSITNPVHNIAIGVEALSNLKAGDSNIAVGFRSGLDMGTKIGPTLDDTNTPASNNNVLIGAGAGSALRHGQGNVFIGNNAGAQIPTNYLGAGSRGTEGILSSNYSIVLGPNASFDTRLAYDSNLMGEMPDVIQPEGMIFISNGPTDSPYYFNDAIEYEKKSPLMDKARKLPLLYMGRNNDYSLKASATGNVDHYMLMTRNLYVHTIAAKGKMNFSDKRIKNITGEYKRGLSDILKITPVTYYFKDAQNAARQQVGVIAQDLQQIMPEAVIKNIDGYYSVKYRHIDMAVVNAVKELDLEQNNIDKRLSDLEKKVNARQTHK